MTEATIAATDIEYEVLHDASGHRCGILVKGRHSNHVVWALCRREGVDFDPGEVRRGKVRWVPARPEQAVERWLLPVEDGADPRGAFTATYMDLR